MQASIGSFAASMLLAAMLSAGCAGYRVGTESLYTLDVRTVHVPMFQSVSFRRNLGERLTEAVVKEIELKTPYKVVAATSADSILTGRIIAESRSTVVPGRVGGQREADIRLRVEVTWVDNRGTMIRQGEPLDLPPEITLISASASIVPEYGHSNATGQQRAIQRVAEQIVAMMEAPW